MKLSEPVFIVGKFSATDSMTLEELRFSISPGVNMRVGLDFSRNVLISSQMIGIMLL